MTDNPLSRLVFAVPMLALWVYCAALVACVRLEDGSGGRTWGTAERIDNDGTAPDVAIDPAANVVTVWTRLDGIWASRHAPGDGWTPPELISGGADPLETAKVAMDPRGNTTAVWSQVFARYRIFTNRYASGAWGLSHGIDDNTGEPFEPQVSVDDDGSAMTVWVQLNGVRDDVWAARFTPSGGWGDPTRIENTNSTDASGAQVAVDPNGNALAVWVQHDATRNRNDVWANRFTPTSGWNPASAQLIEANNVGDASSPQVGVDADGNAVAVWTQSDGLSFHTWANRFTPTNGWNSGSAQRIDANNTGDASDSQVGVDAGGNAVALWVESDDVRSEIWSNRYVPDGDWGEARRVDTNDSGSAQEPRIAVDADGNAVAVWKQLSGTGGSIWSNHYSPTVGWGTAQRVDAEDDGIRRSPRIAMNPGGTAVAVWTVSGDVASTGIWSNRSPE